MAHGLEVRVPFLDQDMVHESMMLCGDLKLRHDNASTQFIEKWALREAFNTPDSPYLPDDVLWRQKEQFSDGVGYGWIDGLKAHANEIITDEARPFGFHTTPLRARKACTFDKYFTVIFPTTSTATASSTPFRGASVACSTSTAIE